MQILWTDDDTIQRAYLAEGVTVKLKSFGGGYYPEWIKDLGYVQQYRNAPAWLACTYGSINPDHDGASFYNIDDAKAYVEQQALLGITINKLTR